MVSISYYWFNCYLQTFLGTVLWIFIWTIDSYTLMLYFMILIYMSLDLFKLLICVLWLDNSEYCLYTKRFVLRFLFFSSPWNHRSILFSYTWSTARVKESQANIPIDIDTDGHLLPSTCDEIIQNTTTKRHMQNKAYTPAAAGLCACFEFQNAHATHSLLLHDSIYKIEWLMPSTRVNKKLVYILYLSESGRSVFLSFFIFWGRVYLTIWCNKNNTGKQPSLISSTANWSALTCQAVVKLNFVLNPRQTRGMIFFPNLLESFLERKKKPLLSSLPYLERLPGLTSRV